MLKKYDKPSRIIEMW